MSNKNIISLINSHFEDGELTEEEFTYLEESLQEEYEVFGDDLLNSKIEKVGNTFNIQLPGVVNSVSVNIEFSL